MPTDHDPVLHVVAGPNGAGKSSFVRDVLQPVVHLPFVNADDIAKLEWPDDPGAHAYEAAQLAAEQRDDYLRERVSFVAETLFSHPSKLDLISAAKEAGYTTTLHVICVPVDLAVARVENRVVHGGHDVPENKIRARYARIWALVAKAAAQVDTAYFYDNARAATAFREFGYVTNSPKMSGHGTHGPIPRGTPAPIRELLRIDFGAKGKGIKGRGKRL